MEDDDLYELVDEQEADPTLRMNYQMTTTYPDDYPEVGMNVSYHNPTYTKDELQNTDYNDRKDTQNVTKKYMNIMAFMLAILLLMTIIATALAIFSCVPVTSIQPIDSNNRSAELAKVTNDFTSQYNQLAEATWTNISQAVTQITNFLSHLNTSLEQCVNIENIEEIIVMNLRPFNQKLQNSLRINCGPGFWHRVVYLNMSDPLQRCPPAWRVYNTSGVRACGRPVTDRGSCAAVSHSISHQYSGVCGRVIGYQFGSPDAFAYNNVDGISLTHGTTRNHIWSYVAGVLEAKDNNPYNVSKCPCNHAKAAQPPSNIGDNYFCESGNHDNDWSANHFYLHDKLWDGEQCEGTCCTGTESPPWFSVQLPAPTIDAIEVRICCDERTYNEDIPVELIEIYVQ